jgi:hypothetical protein
MIRVQRAILHIPRPGRDTGMGRAVGCGTGSLHHVQSGGLRLMLLQRGRWWCCDGEQPRV